MVGSDFVLLCFFFPREQPTPDNKVLPCIKKRDDSQAQNSMISAEGTTVSTMRKVTISWGLSGDPQQLKKLREDLSGKLFKALRLAFP